MHNLVIGQVTINLQGESIVDDFGWGPESDDLETGSVIPIGRVNVFVVWYAPPIQLMRKTSILYLERLPLFTQMVKNQWAQQKLMQDPS